MILYKPQKPVNDVTTSIIIKTITKIFKIPVVRSKKSDIHRSNATIKRIVLSIFPTFAFIIYVFSILNKHNHKLFKMILNNLLINDDYKRENIHYNF